MLANDTKTSRTAYEISERKEEKLLALGPVYEQLNQDLLDPLVNNTFALMVKQSSGADGRWIEGALLPRPPEELQGSAYKIDYVSVMATAQKTVNMGSMERFTSFVGQVAGFVPSVIQKVDADQMVDEYGDALTVPSRILRSDDAVAAIRAQEQQAAQAQARAEMLSQGASAAKDLSQAQVGDENALTRMLQTAQAGQMTGS
jgi:hypothetical protein